MNEFFDSFQTLPVIEKTYWLVAIPSTLLLLIQLVITLTAGDMHGDTDLHSDGADFADGGLHIFTYKNILGFFTIFSWTGLGFLKMGLGIFFTMAFSMVAGFIMMVLMAWMIMVINSLS